MPEEGEKVPKPPEQEGPRGPEQEPQLSFDERVRSLIEGEEPEIKNEKLRRLATSLLREENQTPKQAERLWERGDNFYIDGLAPEEEWSKLAPLIQEKRGVSEAPVQAGGVEDLARAVVALGEQIASGGEVDRQLLEAQRQQTRELRELLRGGGYEALVSTELAQAPISVEQFETQQPVWYRELSPEWQKIIRGRTIISLGCWVKRIEGHVELDPVAGNKQMRIEPAALDLMWQRMPEFRIALATMLDDFFEMRRETPPHYIPLEKRGRRERRELEGLVDSNVLKAHGIVDLMVLKDVSLINRLEDYKGELIRDLTKYFRENPQALIKRERGAPRVNPEVADPAEVAARAGVAAAWNLIYIANAADSGDQGDLGRMKEVVADEGEDPTVGRKVESSVAYAEQVRAMILPFDKARGKVATGDVGTEETWLGDLGDYIAERNRHDPQFRIEFARRQRRIVPQRLFASVFDMFTLPVEVKKEREKKTIQVTLARALHKASKKSLGVGRLWDFENPDWIQFRSLRGDELWGQYADSWDSAKKIYSILGGRITFEDRDHGIRPWRQTLVTALQKMRKTPIGPYFSDPELLVGCIGGSVGLTDFSSEYLLSLPDEEYDSHTTEAVNDDRLFRGMHKGTRKYVLGKLHAYDMHSIFGPFGGLMPTDRAKIRTRASLAARKYRAR